MRPRISFGILVLNGEPFIRYLLRSIYPFAYQILIAEGACAGAVGHHQGHSTDGTLQTLEEFCRCEDPEGKVQIITREGLWGEKTQQCRAFAEKAKGDYLWVCGVDEFYTPAALEAVLEELEKDPSVDMLSFDQTTFWGSIDVWVDGWYLHRGWVRRGVPRVFKWGPGYRYVEHRPDTVVDSSGTDLRRGKWLDNRHTRRWGVRMLHYSLLFPKQVAEKSAYYQRAEWAQLQRAAEWAESTWWRLEHPYRVHNAGGGPSWLQTYEGDHPPAILEMWNLIASGELGGETRGVTDALAIMATPKYRAGRYALKKLQPVATLAFGLAAPPARSLRDWRKRRVAARKAMIADTEGERAD